jgi:hypothetical protein
MLYQYKTSGGIEASVEAKSAGEAINSALMRHQGEKIVRCWRGTTTGLYAGIVEYEIPNRDPFIAKTEAPEPSRQIVQPFDFLAEVPVKEKQRKSRGPKIKEEKVR